MTGLQSKHPKAMPPPLEIVMVHSHALGKMILSTLWNSHSTWMHNDAKHVWGSEHCCKALFPSMFYRDSISKTKTFHSFHQYFKRAQNHLYFKYSMPYVSHSFQTSLWPHPPVSQNVTGWRSDVQWWSGKVAPNHHIFPNVFYVCICPKCIMYGHLVIRFRQAVLTNHWQAGQGIGRYKMMIEQDCPKMSQFCVNVSNPRGWDW